MKRILLVIILLLAFILSWFSYSYLFEEKKSVWSYISKESKFVYILPKIESNNKSSTSLNTLFSKIKNAFNETNFIIENSLYDQKNEGLNQILTHKNGNIENAYIVGYPISLNKVGTVLILDINKKKIETTTIPNRLKKKNNSIEKKEYNETEITTYNINQRKISTFNHDNFVFISTHLTLLEETSRLTNQTEWMKVKSLKPLAYDKKNSKNDLGKIFVHSNNINYLNKYFGYTSTKKNENSLIGHNIMFEISANDEKQQIIFNGMIEKEIKDKKANKSGYDYLNAFDGQTPNKNIDIYKYLPNNADKVINFNLDNINQWRKKSLKFFENGLFDTKIITIDKAKEKVLTKLLKGLKSGITYIELPSIELDLESKLIVSQVKDKYNTFEALKDLQYLYKKDSVLSKAFYNENFVYQLDISSFPSIAFNPIFTGFELCYFSFLDNKIIFANDINTIQNYFDNIKSDKTWATKKEDKYFSNADNNTFINYYKNEIENDNSYQNNFMSNLMSNFSLIQAFFSNKNNKINVQIILSLQNENENKKEELKFIRYNNRNYWFENKLITSPYTTIENTNNVISCFQDNENNLIFSKNFYISFEREMLNKIMTKMNFAMTDDGSFKNVMFATADSLFVIDENGKNVNNYPVSYSKNDVAFVNYMNDENQDILLIDNQNNFFVFDINGELINSWKSSQKNIKLGLEPQQFKVNNNLYFIIQYKNGVIDIKNISGETINGLPISINDELVSPAYIKKGVNYADTFITIIGLNGSITKFNMLGKVLTKKQLLKDNLKTKYYLVLENRNKTYLIYKDVDGNITFYNQREKPIFNAPLSLQKNYNFRYYDYGLNASFYIINDNDQDISYLYDYKFQLINGEPINSINEVILFFNSKEKQLQLYTNYESQYYESIIKLQ